MHNEAANTCAQEMDEVSKQLFEELLAEEEEHVKIFENLNNHVDRLGGAYLATLTSQKTCRGVVLKHLSEGSG